MNKHGKVWGNTKNIFCKNNVEVHRIEAQKGGYSSKHKHNYKYNAFFVERGRLKITVWKNDYDLVDETIISDQEMSTVRPTEYHKFEAIEDTVAYEIYWTEIDEEDIVRQNCGGAH